MLDGFSNYLKLYIEKKGWTITQAAERCGIDRTLLSRYVNGKRVPKNEKIVIQMAENLNMKEMQRQKLMDEYLIVTGKARTGELRFVFDKIFAGDDILMNVKTGGKKSKCQIGEWQHALQLSCEKEITEHVVYVTTGVKKVQLLMNPELLLFMNLISLSNMTENGCKREQIIELNGYESRKNTHNRRMDALLQLLIYQGDYSMYYHYHRINSEEDAHGEMFFIVSDKGLVLFDRTISYGLFSNQKHFVEYYQTIFRDRKKKSQIFGEKIDEEEADVVENKNSLVIQNEQSGTKMIYNREDFKGYIFRKNRKIAVSEEGIVRMLSDYMEQKK